MDVFRVSVTALHIAQLRRGLSVIVEFILAAATAPIAATHLKASINGSMPNGSENVIYNVGYLSEV